jgi:hypothetical protein
VIISDTGRKDVYPVEAAKDTRRRVEIPSTTCVINIRNPALVAEAMRQGRYVYIGRPGKGVPSPWGNPYSHLSVSCAEFRVASLTESLRAYEAYLIDSPLLEQVGDLYGMVLGCFCASFNKFLIAADRQVCHGQVLCRYAEMMKGDPHESCTPVCTIHVL